MENALRTGGEDTQITGQVDKGAKTHRFFHEGETKLLDSVSWPTSFANFECSNIRC
jgi:hypothetical protein